MKKIMFIFVLVGIFNFANTQINTKDTSNVENEMTKSTEEKVDTSTIKKNILKTTDTKKEGSLMNNSQEDTISKNINKNKEKTENKTNKIPNFTINIEAINVNKNFDDDFLGIKNEDWLKNRDIKKISLNCENENCKVIETTNGITKTTNLEKKLTEKEKETILKNIEIIRNSRENKKKEIVKMAKTQIKEINEEYNEGIFVYFEEEKIDNTKTNKVQNFSNEIVEIFNILNYKNPLIRNYEQLVEEDYTNFKYISRLVYGNKGNSYGTIIYCNDLTCDIKKEKDGKIDTEKDITITLTKKEKDEIVTKLVESMKSSKSTTQIPEYFPTSVLTLNTKKVYSLNSDNNVFTDIMADLYKKKKVPTCKIGFFKNNCD